MYSNNDKNNTKLKPIFDNERRIQSQQILRRDDIRYKISALQTKIIWQKDDQFYQRI